MLFLLLLLHTVDCQDVPLEVSRYDFNFGENIGNEPVTTTTTSTTAPVSSTTLQTSVPRLPTIGTPYQMYVPRGYNQQVPVPKQPEGTVYRYYVPSNGTSPRQVNSLYGIEKSFVAPGQIYPTQSHTYAFVPRQPTQYTAYAKAHPSAGFHSKKISNPRTSYTAAFSGPPLAQGYVRPPVHATQTPSTRTTIPPSSYFLSRVNQQVIPRYPGDKVPTTGKQPTYASPREFVAAAPASYGAPLPAEYWFRESNALFPRNAL